MSINRENYEIYFLDYYEGHLEPGQIAELLVFLEANPEFKEEFEGFEHVPIMPDTSIFFADKNALKKNEVAQYGPINSSNYETYFIADTEKQLTPGEERWLRGFLKKNTWLKDAHRLYLSTRLQPNLRIHYPGKAGLRRSIFDTRRFYYYTFSAAASIALLIAVFLNSGTKQESLFSARQKPTSSQTTAPKIQSQLPQQPVSDHPVALVPKIHPQAASNQLAYHIEKEQPMDERKPIAGIPSRMKIHIASRDVVEPGFLFIRRSRNTPEVYANLFDQVNLAQRIQHEKVMAPVVSSPGSVFRSGLRKLGNIFMGKESPSNSGTIDLWKLADLGISGYNLLADKDLKLLTLSDDSGKVVSYAIKSEGFEFIRSQPKPVSQ